MAEMAGLGSNTADPPGFNCAIDYQVWCEKIDGRKSVWKTFSNQRPIVVRVTPSTMTYESFTVIIENACNLDRAKMGTMIQSDRRTIPHPYNITRRCSILNVILWAKVKKRPLLNDDHFETWAAEALKFPGKQAGVTLKMNKPVSQAAQINNDNLIERACRRIPINNGDAQKRVLNDDDDAEEIDLLVDKLSKLGKLDSRIDPMIPVFCLLDGSDKHVLLTPGNINKWAKAIHNPAIHGVNVTSPPQDLRKPNPPDSKNRVPPRQHHGYVDAPPNYFAGSTQEVSNHAALDQPSAPMGEYIEFVKIVNPEILLVLTREEITDHHQFGAGTIKIDHLRDLGFPLGVISKLLDNLDQLDEHLCLKE